MGDTNSTVAITYSSLDEVIMNLYNQIDIIINDLNDIKSKFEDINLYFTGDVAASFQNKFSAFSSKYEVIKSNLNSYAEDLKIIKRVYQNVDEEAANELKKIALQLQEEADKIEQYKDLDLTIK